MNVKNLINKQENLDLLAIVFIISSFKIYEKSLNIVRKIER